MDIAAWREHRLAFRNTPLSEVAREFNRYNRIQIRPEGDIGQSKRLTGSFSSDHPQSLILYLQREPAVSVTLVGGTYLVRAASPP
jgi:transmembrane sensor